MLSFRLALRKKSIEGDGLLDTGAAISVLPFSLGKQLGADWTAPAPRLRLAGNLAGQEARGIVIAARVAKFEWVNLAFAWTKSDDIPLILGHMNFFREFDVCFYGSKMCFDIRPKS